jgi:carbon storage regulator CsrA
VLVLSRRPHEKIVFPGIRASVQILGIKPGAVRLGIDAPPEVKVLREELAQDAVGETLAGLQHLETRLRNRVVALQRLLEKRLGIAEKGLTLLRGQLPGGLDRDVLATLDELQGELHLLQERLRNEAANALRREARTAPKRKALLVEDNPQERELMALFLRSEGLDVDTAPDGCDALDYLQARDRPDVVLLDMGLPRVDGPTTVREIRRNPACAGLKIFAVSGRSAEDCKLPIGPAGVDGWFQKPVDPMTIVHDLKRVFEHSPGGV